MACSTDGLSLGVVQNLRFVGRRRLGGGGGGLTEFFAIVDVDGVRRGLAVFIHHLNLRRPSRLAGVVPLELQVGLQGGVDLLEAATATFDLVDQLDAFKPCQRRERIDRVRIDVAVGKAGVDLLVTDPAAFATGFDEFGESGIWTQ